jgi:hypothetical protein
LEKFSCIKGLSGSGKFNPETDLKTVYSGVFSDSVAFNKKVHVFFLGMYTLEGQRMKSPNNALKLAGIHNTYYEAIGTLHEWLI